MTQTLKIENYRGYKSYTVADLARVNLLVGRNNCGKTSILEALQLLVADNTVGMLVAAAGRRGEVKGDRPSAVDVSQVFTGRRLQPGKRLRVASDSDAVTVEVVEVTDLDDEQARVIDDIVADPELADPVYALTTGITPGRPASVVAGLAADGTMIRSRRVRTRLAPGRNVPLLITPESLGGESMRSMWNVLVSERREHHVVEVLKILEPDLEDITFLFSEGKRGYRYTPLHGRDVEGIVLGLCNVRFRVPLGNYGDGMRRVLALSVCLMTTSSSILLIDEIDSGLHWTIMDDIWKMVIAAAHERDVQVFATTHSYDCIRSLANVVSECAEYEHSVSIQKIEPRLDTSVSFAGESLRTIRDQDIEVR